MRTEPGRRSGQVTRLHRVIPAILIIAVGCSGGDGQLAARSTYDSEKAREALVAALDAWKKGEAKGLATRKPPIRFVDEDFASGMRLSDYEIEDPDRPISLHENVEVILSLRDARGNTIRRETRYQVATEPGLAVLRSGR